jgi:hypothetical protein
VAEGGDKFAGAGDQLRSDSDPCPLSSPSQREPMTTNLTMDTVPSVMTGSGDCAAPAS